MPEESTVSNIVKTASDGTVKIAVEKYNELIEAAAKPTVINRTVSHIVKTPKMAKDDHLGWGIGFMTLGVGALCAGAVRLWLSHKIDVG